MKKQTPSCSFLLLLLALSVGLSGCAYLQLGSALAGGPELPVLTAPPVYAAVATEGVAVDAESGQPLEGVIVVAYWELTGFHAYPVGLMMVQEGMTDTQGRFVLPAWGPKPRSPLTGQLRSMEPELLAFKSGYVEQYEPREVPERKKPQRVLKLKKFTGSLEEYAKRVGFVDSALRFTFRYDDCAWKQIPRMLVAMHIENKRFSEQGLRASSDYPSSIEDKDYSYRISLAKCGSIKEFLRSYLP